MALFPQPFFRRGKKRIRQAFSEAKGKKYFFLKLGFVCIMLGLIAFSVYQCVQHITVGMDTLRTQEMVDETYVNLNLYVFRDETVKTSDGQVFVYHVADGAKVGAHTTLATAYICPQGMGVSDTQASLTALADRMAMLQRPVGKDHPAEADELSDAIDTCYLSYLDAVSQGNLELAQSLSARMEGYMHQYDVLMNGEGHVSETLGALRNAQESIVSYLQPVAQVTTSPSGYFYYDVDGFESTFTAQKALTMSAEEFLQLTQSTAQPKESGVAGKMANNATWYAAAYVSLSDATAYQDSIGQTFLMETTDQSGVSLSMELVRMEIQADGAMLVFRTQSIPHGFTLTRSFSVMTKISSVSGYRVPDGALYTLDGVQGVYVLEGNVVEFRKVMLKADYDPDDGYVMVSTYQEIQSIMEGLSEEQQEAFGADGYPYLNFNDKIITRGTGLYDGKIVG